MVRSIRTVGVAFVLLVSATHAQAQIPDHLQCFKIKDAAAKASYLAVLTPSDMTFPAVVGCTIKVPAKLLCVDAVKSNVTPAPPGAADGIAGQKYLCYKTKCPKNQPTATLTDQFGSHAIEVKTTGLVCAPIPPAFTCSDAMTNGDETDVDCGGSCPACSLGQQCLVASDCTSGICSASTCVAPPATCVDLLENGSESDVDCGGGACPACAPGQGCFAASDCSSGLCSGGLCQSLLSNGSVCSSGAQCGSGSCTDSVCCDTACASTCAACTAAKKGSGADGTCGLIAPSTDPDNECAGANTCNGMGTCTTLLTDGSVCMVGGQCLSGSCVDGVCCASSCASTCEACTAAKKGVGADGSCGPISVGTDPDNECAGANTCTGGGSCTALSVDGTSCLSGAQCFSGFCVDSVCCNSGCSSLCQACTAAKKGFGADGSCASISASTDPDNECAGAQTCDGGGACMP